MVEKQFDEKIRAKLAEPQEQLPDGLWDGIASRLDAAAQVGRRRGGVLFRRWIAGLSSAAAVLVAGAVAVHFIQSAEPVPEPVAMTAAAGQEPEKAGTMTASVPEPSETAGSPESLEVRPAGIDAYMAVAEIGDPASGSGVPAEEGAPSGEVPGDADSLTVMDRFDVAVKKDGAQSRLLAMAEGECELGPDNSDIEAVYGPDEDGGEKRIPLEVTVGGNSFAGPQKEPAPRRMMAHGHKANAVKTFKEGSSTASYSLPISFGVGLKYRITGWLGIGTGVNYTLLEKKVTGTWYDEHGWNYSTDMKNSQHYIGIPVDIYFSMFRTERWDAYATVGGTVEKCVMNRYTGTLEGRQIGSAQKAEGVQASVKAGLGIEFSPVEFLGIYIDPSVRYFFNNGQPKSIRTEQPLSFGVEAGLRFKL